ncbi:MAG: isochorismatase family protein [Actinomycetota bacterium]
MTTLPDRSNAALLVIDVQNGVVANAHQRDSVIAHIGVLVERARTERVSVIWVQHTGDDLREGSDEWQYVPELQRQESEPLIHKRYGDSFEDTALEDELARAGVGRLLICGAETDACVRSTLHGAFTRGYDTFLVSDAHTTNDYSQYGAPPADQVIAHTNLYWRFQAAPGREAGVVDTASVAFTSPATDATA